MTISYAPEELREAARSVRTVAVLHGYLITPLGGPARPGPTILNMSEAEEIVKAVWGVDNHD